IKNCSFADVVVGEYAEVMPMARLAIGVDFWDGTVASNVNQCNFLPKSSRRCEHRNRRLRELEVGKFGGDVRLQSMLFVWHDNVPTPEFEKDALICSETRRIWNE